MTRKTLLVSAMLAMMATAADAHTGVGSTSGFVHGFMHPISGVDHILAMVAVGLFAVQLGGRALWLVPLSFVSMMVVGGVLGMSGVNVPFVEIGIGLSVVVLGAIVAFNWKAPTVAAMAICGLFAIFHGHAHGAEMPDSAGGASYALGFVLATALLHVVGIGLGITAGRYMSSRVARIGGAAMALAGIGILNGAI